MKIENTEKKVLTFAYVFFITLENSLLDDTAYEPIFAKNQIKLSMMKKYILTLLFAVVFMTSCEKNEYYYKTPGEITGEKIMELVESGYPSSCYIYPSYLKKEVNFTIEGQFLYVYDKTKSYAFDLNHLNSWIYHSDLRVFEFYFKEME